MSICIFHSNCADGFSAAWAVWKVHQDWEFYPGVYQNPPPLLKMKGKDVVMVDFSYKRETMEMIVNEASSVVVLDHHKTAADDLIPMLNDGSISGVFDMDRSGAMIAWDWFHPDVEPPKLLLHVQDRDLWKFELEGTREIQAAVFSYPYEFELWDSLMRADTNNLFVEGQAIERKHHKDIAELTKVVTRMMTVGGFEVPIANLPYTLTSDAGHLLCGEVQSPPGVGGPTVSRYPFAGCYWDTPEGRVFSLRSRDDGFDVSDIAKEYGGGGHAHASGFRVLFDHELAK